MQRLRLDPTAPNGISIAPDDPSMGQLRRQNNGYVSNKATGLIKAGTNVTLTGSGVSNDPYVINSSGSGGGTTLPANATGWLHDDGAGTLAWTTPAKSDVGLGNVDNTSDATKNSATASLTNKDLTSATNTFPTFNQDTTGKSAKTDALNSATTTVNVASATAPTAGQVLTATSSTAATWQTPASGGMSNPMTTLGDMIYEDGTPIQTRLAGNTTTTKKFLTQTGTGSASAAPAWGTIAAADVPTLNQNTTGTASNVTGTVSIAHGGTGATTQQAAINALSGTQASGKYLRSDGTNTTLASIQAADVPTLNQTTTGTAAGITGKTTPTGALVGDTDSQTLTNKTLTSPKVNQLNDTNGKTAAIIDATASAVNYLELTNAATGNGVGIKSAGSDTNVDLILNPKGSGMLYMRDGGGNTIISAGGTNSTPSPNYVQIVNAIAGNAPFIGPAGTDTNIDLQLGGHGTGTPTINTSNGLKFMGASSVPATPASGFGKIAMAGTGNVRPKFMNASGTYETILTDSNSITSTSGGASVATNQSTTSTTYTDLTTVGPAVTVTVPPSGMVLVCIKALIFTSSAAGDAYASFAASGANTIGATDANGISNKSTSGVGTGASIVLTGLTAGSTTFTMKYRAGGDTGGFLNRYISVVPL